jgi:hypothetical protein
VRFRDHHLRISSIHGHSRYDRVLTIHDVSAPARLAHSVLAGEEADTDSLTDFPSGYRAAKGFNVANYFVSRNTRQCEAGIGSCHCGRIAVTDSACLHANPNLTRPGLGDWTFYYSKNARC